MGTKEFIIYFQREPLQEGVARTSAPQQAVARGKTILSDHPASQASERSTGAKPTTGGATASTVTGELSQVSTFWPNCFFMIIEIIFEIIFKL